MKQWYRSLSGIVAALVFLSMAFPALAFDKTWTGTINQDWFNPNNWSPAVVPASGEDVLAPNVANGILLTNSTPMLSSFTITNLTMVFSNWNTTLNATNVYIRNLGQLTMPASFSTSVPSNNICIGCTNFTLDLGGSIYADGLGYAATYGPGAGTYYTYASGGGHGGKGGVGANPWYGSIVGGVAYGSANAPLEPGSGSGYTWAGGGGAVRIVASGAATINGTISANGQSASATFWQGAGASGGSIYLTCGTFGGATSGLLQANGGTDLVGYYGGGGGGGRIAVNYGSLATPHAVRFSTSYGASGNAINDWGAHCYLAPQNGTVWLPDAALLSETLADQLFTSVRLVIPGFTSWTVDSLTVSNCSLTFAAGFSLTVNNDLRIDANGSLGIGDTNNAPSPGPVLNCGGSLILTNGGKLYVYSAMTNGATTAYGALVSVTNDLLIGPSSWIYPFSHSMDGGSVLFTMRNAVIGTNAGFNADGKGFQTGSGPGVGTATTYPAGGGYGGRGGNNYAGNLGGSSNGFTNAPTWPGSGGGSSWGYDPTPHGAGGLVRLAATEKVTVNGTITANGGNANDFNGTITAGGSGGGILIACSTFGGSANGVLQAKGGNNLSAGGNCGGGGGGRIAVWIGLPAALQAVVLAGQTPQGTLITSNYSRFFGNLYVNNGTSFGSDATPGTVRFLKFAPVGTLVTFH